MQQTLLQNCERIYRFLPPATLHPVLIVLMVLFAYGGGLSIFFCGAGLYTITASQHDIHAFLGQNFYWRPLTSYTYHILYDAFGLNPLPYHVFDLTIHSLNALLVYYIARKLSKDSVIALLAGLMFAAFYRHSGLLFSGGLFYDLGYTLFSLAAILSFLHYQDTNRARHLATALACILIALPIKDSAAMLFPIILVLDQLYRPHPLPRIRWGLILCLVSAGVIYLVLRTHFLPSSAGGSHELLRSFGKLGVHESFYQIRKGLFVTISNVCPGRDLSYVFYFGFIVFLWKATEYRRLAVTVGLPLLISTVPLLFTYGSANRYLYFSTALSVIFLAAVIRYTARTLAGRMLPSYGETGVGLVTGAVLLLVLSFNVYKIKTYETQYRDASELFRSNLEDIATAFPEGTSGFSLYLVRHSLTPRRVLPQRRPAASTLNRALLLCTCA